MFGRHIVRNYEQSAGMKDEAGLSVVLRRQSPRAAALLQAPCREHGRIIVLGSSIESRRVPRHRTHTVAPATFCYRSHHPLASLGSSFAGLSHMALLSSHRCVVPASFRLASIRFGWAQLGFDLLRCQCPQFGRKFGPHCGATWCIPAVLPEEFKNPGVQAELGGQGDD